MNWDQIYSLIRSVLLSVGMFAVTHGWATQAQLEAIVGGVVALVAVGLSMIFHSEKGQSLMPMKPPST